MAVKQPNPPGILLSRRDTLRVFSLTTASFLLAACAPKPIKDVIRTLTPPPLTKPSPFPDSATNVPMFEVGGIQVPDPKASNPELFDVTNPDSPIVQFANAFGVKPEDVGDLTPQLLTGVDGKQFIVLTTNDLTATANFDETGTPLLIAEQGENGEWGWNKTTLQKAKELSDLKNFGVLLSPNKPEAAKVETSEFDLGAVTFSWNDHVDQNGNVDLSWSDRQFREASDNNMDTIFQHILFANDTPSWIDQLSQDEVKSLMDKVITSVMTRYKDKIEYFVVVNEPFVKPYRNRDPFYKAFDNSYDYIEYSFSLARKANPNAFLIYNDSGNHSSDSSSVNGLTTNITKEITGNLKSKGLIDGVGVQMHIDASKPPTGEDIVATLNSYELPVLITELDIDMSNVKGTPEEKNIIQAELYQRIIRAAKSTNTISITLWGVGDENSWLERNGKTEANPTIFNDDFTPKASYFSIMTELLKDVNN